LKHSALKHLKAMLDDPKTSEAAKVKIIDMILKHDMNLLESLYAPSRGDEMVETEKVEDVQPQHKPAFSLHMIPPKTEEE
jgi:ABC-type antimicrobial peptide transport system ATPase subunit